MADLKDIIVNGMFDSMETYIGSNDYLEKEKTIQKSLGELYEMLNSEQHKKLIMVLDLVNDSDCCYAEEAYFRGFLDAIKTKI